MNTAPGFVVVIRLPHEDMVQKALGLYEALYTKEFAFEAMDNTNSPSMLHIEGACGDNIDSYPLTYYLEELCKECQLTGRYTIDVVQIMSSESTIEGIRASMMTPPQENVGAIVESCALARILEDREPSHISIRKRLVVTALSGEVSVQKPSSQATINTSLKRITKELNP